MRDHEAQPSRELIAILYILARSRSGRADPMDFRMAYYLICFRIGCDFEVSKDWPVSAALANLSSRIPIRILVRRPFRATDFNGLKATEDAGIATAWRNNRGRKYAVLLLGPETGTLDAGLKDVRPLSRAEVVVEWRTRVVKRIGALGDLSKFEVQDLLSALFSNVASGEIPAGRLEEYTKVIERTPSVEAVCNNLWRLGLIPDAQAVDKAMAGARLRRNKQLVSQLRESEGLKDRHEISFRF